MQSVIKTVYYDKNRILCGTSIGEIYEFNLHNHHFSLIFQNNDRNPIYHISKSISGELVVGSTSPKEGLMFISDTPSLHVQTEFAVKGEGTFRFASVICVCEISNDVFLIGTKEKGLFFYDKSITPCFPTTTPTD